jgi:hypothetical protein
MNRYVMIHRLRGPAILLLIGVVALLHQLNIIDNFWHWFWPLLLITLGVLLLVERAILASEGGYPATPYPGATPPGAIDPNAATSVPAYPGQPEANFPTRTHNPEDEGGLS